MTDIEKFTLGDAHTKFAQRSNGRVWELLEKNPRTDSENEEMIEAAHASLYHWRAVGTALHLQRGKWLLSHVHTMLKDESLALKYARECLSLTEANKSQMKDFDIAYAYEAMARASALHGKLDEAKKYHDMAHVAGEQIIDDEDRKIFAGDFSGGEWFGII